MTGRFRPADGGGRATLHRLVTVEDTWQLSFVSCCWHPHAFAALKVRNFVANNSFPNLVASACRLGSRFADRGAAKMTMCISLYCAKDGAGLWKSLFALALVASFSWPSAADTTAE